MDRTPLSIDAMTHLAQDHAAPARRASSARRAANLQALLAALHVDDLDLDGVIAVLSCSPSAARNYVKELVDTRQVTAERLSRSRGRTGCAVVYRVEHSPETVTRRDPLVAALFG